MDNILRMPIQHRPLERCGFCFLQQRGNDFQQAAGYFVEKVFVLYTLGCGASGLHNTGIKIKSDILNARGIIQLHCAFKMMVQAAVVQIDRAYHRFLIVRHHYFCVYETGCVFENFHARLG